METPRGENAAASTAVTAAIAASASGDEWRVSAADVAACSFGSWHAALRDVTIPSRVFRLPHDHPFVRYLHADGVFVHHDRAEYAIHEDLLLQPASQQRQPASQQQQQRGGRREGGGRGGRRRGGERDPASEPEVQAPSFPELEAEMREAIAELGGAVFPKLNWSAPKDATWISTTGTLKCDSPSEVFVLLKSSDFVVHDLAHAFDCCYPPAPPGTRPECVELVLRRWCDLAPSLEFRCFVLERCLVGISQRDHASFYPFLRELRPTLKALIVDFFVSTVAPRFPLSDYVFDVYVSKGYDRVWLVDFGPSATTTEPLLFDWIELLDKEVPADRSAARLVEWVEFRVVESQTGVRPTTAHLNHVPRDMYDLSSGQGIDEFVAACRSGLFGGRGGEGDSSSESAASSGAEDNDG